MVRGLYAANLGMTTQMKKLDVTANNIANVNTTGFKKESVATQSFHEEFMKRLDDPGTAIIGHSVNIGKVSSGVFVDTVFTNFAQGSVNVTNNPLDLSIMGDGFFAVQVADSNGNTAEKYTRDGNLTLANGYLVTRDGGYVVGSSGPIAVPEGDITIDEAGNIYSNGEFVNRIKVVDFEDKSTLRKIKDNMYETTGDSVEAAAAGLVKQGTTEASNVNSAREMIEMITINRTYEANQRVITTIDTTLNRAVNDIASRR